MKRSLTTRPASYAATLLQHSLALVVALFLAMTARAELRPARNVGSVGAEIGVGTEGFRLGLGMGLTPFIEIDVGLNYMPAITISGNMHFRNSTITIPPSTPPSSTAPDPPPPPPPPPAPAAPAPSAPAPDDPPPSATIPDASASGKTYHLNTVRVEGKFDRLSFDAKLYLYPFGSAASFFLVGGVSAGGGRLAWLNGHSDEAQRIYEENREYFDQQIGQYEDMVETVVGKTALSLAKNGNVAGEVRVPKVRPYVGLGFGRMVTDDGVGARLEAGVEFTGKLKVYQGNIELDYQDYLERADNNLAKLMDRMRVYPVLKLTLTGRLF